MRLGTQAAIVAGLTVVTVGAWLAFSSWEGGAKPSKEAERRSEATRVLVEPLEMKRNQAEIGSNSIIAAGAIVLEDTKVPPGTIFAGVPAKKVKDIEISQITGEIDRIANNYVKYADWFRDQVNS